MSRNAFRDFFRRRRVRQHFTAHGGVFTYHGVDVRLPQDVSVAAANALIRGKYEQEEAALILKYLPPDLPVIEIGGSLGVVSALIRSRLSPSTRHLIVEANPRLIETCAANAKRGAAAGASEVIHGALYYDGPVARFAVSEEVHSSALASKDASGDVIEVTAVMLADLYRKCASPDRFVLISDIEGAEFDLFAREMDTLKNVALAIVELHPREYRHAGREEAELLRNAANAGLHVVERIADVVVLRPVAH